MTTVKLIKDDSDKMIMQISHGESTTTIVFPNKYVYFEQEMSEESQITFEDDLNFQFPYKIIIGVNTIKGKLDYRECKTYLKLREQANKDSHEIREKVKSYRGMEFEYPISCEMFYDIVNTLKSVSEFKYVTVADFDSNENEILSELETYSFENTPPGIIYNGYSTEDP